MSLKFILTPAILLGCSVFWALGGYKHKIFRSLGVPALIGVLAYMVGVNWILCGISALAMWGASTIGYGIPDENDEGSPLGQWALKLTSDEDFAKIIVRSVCGLAYAGALLPLAHSWLWATIMIFFVWMNTTYWGAIADNTEPIYPPLTNEELLIGLGIGIGWCLVV